MGFRSKPFNPIDISPDPIVDALNDVPLLRDALKMQVRESQLLSQELAEIRAREAEREKPWNARQMAVIKEATHMMQSFGADGINALAQMMQADALNRQANAIIQIGTTLAEIAENMGK